MEKWQVTVIYKRHRLKMNEIKFAYDFCDNFWELNCQLLLDSQKWCRTFANRTLANQHMGEAREEAIWSCGKVKRILTYATSSAIDAASTPLVGIVTTVMKGSRPTGEGVNQAVLFAPSKWDVFRIVVYMYVYIYIVVWRVWTLYANFSPHFGAK